MACCSTIPVVPNPASSGSPRLPATRIRTTQFDRKSHYFDPASTRETPRWQLVDIAFKCKLARAITLTELKEQPRLEEFALLRRGNRLSILPVTKAQWACILSLE